MMSRSSIPARPAARRGTSRRGLFARGALAAGLVASQRLLSDAAWAARKSLHRLPTGRVLGANDRVAVAYVGTGKQGLTHVRIGKANAARFNIQPAAVCDVYDKHLARARAELDLPESAAVRDYRRLLDRADLDAVVVSTVDTWHADVAIDAMDAGKHVFGEKPLARHLHEGFAIHDTQRRTGRVFQIGSQYCMDEKIQQAAAWIRQGRIGPLVWAQGGYCRNHPKNSEWTYPIDPDVSPSNLDWNRWLGRVPRVPFNPEHYFCWHKFLAYNSGILGNLLSHTFLPLLLATGRTDFPLKVSCTGTRAISTDREIPDTTHVLCELPGGLTFCIVGSTVNEQGLPPLIRGLKGTIAIPFSQNQATLTPERPYAEEIDPETFSSPEPPASVERLEQDFYDCIRSGDQPRGHILLALQAHVILSLAELSQRTGHTVHYDAATRAVRDADGRRLRPIDYRTRLPAPRPEPLPTY